MPVFPSIKSPRYLFWSPRAFSFSPFVCSITLSGFISSLIVSFFCMSEKFIHGSPFLLRCSQPLSWFSCSITPLRIACSKKKFLTSGIGFLIVTAVTGIAYVCFQMQEGYNPLKTKWLLHIHVFASLYGSNLSGKTLTWQNKWQICNSYGECLDIRYEYGTGAVKTGWKINWYHGNSGIPRFAWYFREDQCRKRVGNAAENFAMVRHIATNLLKQENSMKKSINVRRLQAGWDNFYLMKVLGVNTI